MIRSPYCCLVVDGPVDGRDDVARAPGPVAPQHLQADQVRARRHAAEGVRRAADDPRHVRAVPVLVLAGPLAGREVERRPARGPAARCGARRPSRSPPRRCRGPSPAPRPAAAPAHAWSAPIACVETAICDRTSVSPARCPIAGSALIASSASRVTSRPRPSSTASSPAPRTAAPRRPPSPARPAG